MALGYFELLFKRTLDDNKNGKGYVVVPTNNKIIRDRLVKSERLTLLLNPQFHDFSFDPILDLIRDCEDTLKNKADVVDKEDKLAWLTGFKDIINDFKEKENPKEEAIEDFMKIIQSQTKVDPYIKRLVKNDFSKVININERSDFEVNTKCYSKCMTNDDCVKFWLSEKSMNSSIWGERVTNIVKSVIISFLAKDLNCHILHKCLKSGTI